MSIAIILDNIGEPNEALSIRSVHYTHKLAVAQARKLASVGFEERPNFKWYSKTGEKIIVEEWMVFKS